MNTRKPPRRSTHSSSHSRIERYEPQGRPAPEKREQRVDRPSKRSAVRTGSAVRSNNEKSNTPINTNRRNSTTINNVAHSDTAIHNAAMESGEPRKRAANERKIYGINACLAVVQHRPEAVIRGYFSEAVGKAYFSATMKYLAQAKRAYHIVAAEELAKITETQHHEGVCLLVRDEPQPLLSEWLRGHRPHTHECLLILDDVGNPHNVGAAMRVAAHFGVTAFVLREAKQARSGAAVRTAEGGAECLTVLHAPDLGNGLHALKRAGYTLVGTSSHEGHDLFEASLPARCVFLLGSETEGLSPEAQTQVDMMVKIPGTGKVESLNVSVATGILMAEHWRRFQRTTQGT